MKKKHVLSHEIMPLIKEMISNNQSVDITVAGHSMVPFYKHHQTLVTLIKPNEIKRFDVILYHEKGIYNLHRVTKLRKDNYIVYGDGVMIKEIIQQHQIVGVVKKHKHKKWIENRNTSYLMKVYIWHLLKPFRRLLLKFYKRT